jgi:hypothetical protein
MDDSMASRVLLKSAVKFCLPLLLLAAVCPIAAAPSEFTTWIAGGNPYRMARIAADAAGDTFIARIRTTSAYDFNCCFVSIGGTVEAAVYGGLAPGAASAVFQVNFLVNPRNRYSSGPVTQSLAVQTQDGTYSLPVNLWVAK